MRNNPAMIAIIVAVILIIFVTARLDSRIGKLERASYYRCANTIAVMVGPNTMASVCAP